MFCRHPASSAPLFSAVIALLLSEPKLMPEMFTIDCGRKALARPRARPMTLAHGSGVSSPVCAWVDGATSEKVRCLMIG